MADSVTADKLIEDLHTVIRDAESLLNATASQAGEGIQAARARAEESVRDAKTRLADVETQALHDAHVLAKDADQYVRANPWQSIGIAATVGLVLGLLISRR